MTNYKVSVIDVPIKHNLIKAEKFTSLKIWTMNSVLDGLWDFFWGEMSFNRYIRIINE